MKRAQQRIGLREADLAKQTQHVLRKSKKLVQKRQAMAQEARTWAAHSGYYRCRKCGYVVDTGETWSIIRHAQYCGRN